MSAITYTPTKADLIFDREERERYWRENVTPVYGGTPEEQQDLLQAWRMEDLQHRPKPNWLIDNVVEEEGLTVFFAGDKLGKTAVLSSMLWGWTAGHDYFLDEQYQFQDPQDGEPRKVLYILLEGTGTYFERFDSWRNRYATPDLGFDNRFVVVTEPVILFDPRMKMDQPETWPDSLRRLSNTVSTMRPQILVIDTFARATPGVDENSSQLGAVVGVLDQIRNAYSTATILVHHTPVDEKTKRPRGWGGLKAAASSYVWIEGQQDEKVKTFGTGPHRNAEFTRKVKFVTRPYMSQFVVDVPQAVDFVTNEGQQELLSQLQASGEWMLRSELETPGDSAGTTNDRLEALLKIGAVQKQKGNQGTLWRAVEDLEEL